MGLIDSIREVFSDDEGQVTAADILNKVREKYPHLAGMDDGKLSSALSKKYPDKFGYLKTYAPDAPVPPALVPKSLRTDAFYKAHPDEGTKEALAVIDQVKAKYPKYKSMDARTMASALETKYPDVFPGLAAKLTPGESVNSGDPEMGVASPFVSLPNLGPGQLTKPVTPPKIDKVPGLPKPEAKGQPQPKPRPMVISLDSTKVSLPKGTPVQTFKNGNEAYLAAEKAGRPIIVEYPNRHGQMIRRILGTTDVETEAPTGAPSIVQTIAKKVEDLGGTLGKATPEIVGKAVVETLNSPPDFLNITQEQQARTARNIATSGVSTFTGMAGAVPAMSRFIGADGKALDGFDKAIEKLNGMAVKIAPEDPTFGDKLSQGAASMAAFWVPGMAAEKAISQLPRLGAYAAMIAKAAKIATPTVLESATEQGGVYNDLVQKGMDEEDAAKRSFGAFWKNIILLGITNALGFGPEAKTRLGKSLMAMPAEGFQEGGQAVIEKISKGEKVDWGEVAADAGVGSILGFAGGSAFGGGGPGVDMTDTATKPGETPTPPPTMSPEMRTYLDKVAEINKAKTSITQPDFLKEDIFKVPTQKEANAAEDVRFSAAPDTVQRMAHSIRNEAVSQYNLDRDVFNQWKDLIGPGLQPPKIISGQRDVMGEYNTLEVWMKKKDGRPIDVVAQDAVETGLIKRPEDIFDALRRLKAPANPSRNAVDYLDEAIRIHNYESSIEPQGPSDTSFEFKVEQTDFSAEAPTTNKENYTVNLAKARIAGMPLREAVAFARESSITQGQKDAVSAFNKIITANKITDQTFVQFVESIKVDPEAFKKGYGAEFQADKYAVRGATFPIKNHPVVKALVQFASGAHAGTGYHEAFHVISTNVLTKQEYAVLQTKFGTEENIAESFAKYEKGKTGKEKQTAIKAIFDKISAFLARLRAYFSGHGWRTAEDVFRGVSEGRTEKSNRVVEGPKFQATPKDQTETPEFKRWFGDSEVVDADGKPLVVYHGTSEKGLTGDSFSKELLGAVTKSRSAKAGFYFVENKDAAVGYSRLANAKPVQDLIDKSNAAERAGKFDLANRLMAQAEKLEQTSNPKDNVVGAYLSIKNPFEFDAENRRFLDIQDEIHHAIRQAKAGGNDGIVFRNLIDNAYWGSDRALDHWVAFEPTQIKSATGNSGAFDPKNPSILYQAEKTGLVDESVYEKNRAMQRSGSLIRDIGNVATSAKDQAESLLTPISSVLADIHPMLRIAFRHQAYREGLKRHEDTRAVLPFLEKARAMRPEDRADLDLALKNGDAPKIGSLVSAYGLDAEYKAARKTLDAIHARAKEVGYDVGYLEDYWPRVIKDQAGFLAEMKNDKKWPDIEKLISMKQDEMRRPLSEDEKVALINSYLRGYQNGAIALARTPNMKTREVEVIGPDLNQHFRRFDDAVVRYISSMNHAIEARRFFGRGGKDLFVDELDQSIGHYVMDMRTKGFLKDARDEKRLREILNAYFKQESMHGALAAYKDATVAMTMGNAISALTQLQDLGTSVYRAPGHVVQSLGRALIGGSKITLEDLGLEQIAEELRDERKSAVFVSKILRAAGLAKLDKITAETFINSVIKKYQSKANKKQPGAEFMDRIRNLVGPDTQKAIEDLKSGEVTDLVKFIAFSEILGVQPKAMTELPEAYLSGGNGRIFYTLKTFQLRQIDMFRQEVFKKMAEPGLKNKIIGTRRLVAMTVSLLLAGMGADELKDLFLGRTTTLSDRVADNILKLVGFSKWTLYKARQEGIASAGLKTILPPVPLVDHLWKDIRTSGDKKGLEVVQSIPLVGKFYYWWMGRGRFKKPLNDDMRWLKENAGKLGLTRSKAYQFLNKTSTRSLLADSDKERAEALEKVEKYAKRLRDMAESRKDELLARESKRKARKMAR